MMLVLLAGALTVFVVHCGLTGSPRRFGLYIARTLRHLVLSIGELANFGSAEPPIQRLITPTLTPEVNSDVYIVGDIVITPTPVPSATFISSTTLIGSETLPSYETLISSEIAITQTPAFQEIYQETLHEVSEIHQEVSEVKQEVREVVETQRETAIVKKTVTLNEEVRGAVSREIGKIREFFDVKVPELKRVESLRTRREEQRFQIVSVNNTEQKRRKSRFAASFTPGFISDLPMVQSEDGLWCANSVFADFTFRSQTVQRIDAIELDTGVENSAAVSRYFVRIGEFSTQSSSSSIELPFSIETSEFHVIPTQNHGNKTHVCIPKVTAFINHSL